MDLVNLFDRYGLRRSPLRAYGLAVGLPVLGVLVRLAAAPPDAGVPWVTFFPLVFVVCALCGIGPAMVATGLSVVIAAHTLIPPFDIRAIPADQWWSIAGFAIACAIGCVPIELLHRVLLRHRTALRDLDASERRCRRVEMDLRQSQVRYEMATRAAFGLVYEWDIQADRVYRSAGLRELLGFAPEDLPPDAESWNSRIHPDDRARIDAVWRQALASGQDNVSVEYRIRHADGHWVHLWDRNHLVRDPEGRPLRLYGASIDATERIRSEAALREALAHRDAMIREVHHRVKNSLQTVSSLLAVQSRVIADGAAGLAFQDAIGRIQAVATVHQALYQDNDLTRVRLGDHVRALCQHVASVHRGRLPPGVGGNRLRCTTRITDAVVMPDELVPIALILNELLTNAFKHGLAGREQGEVRVTLDTVDGELRLTVQDDGPGLPPGLDPATVDSLGMKLVGLLVAQLGGTWSAGPAPDGAGTRVTVRLPGRQPAEAAA